MDMWPGASAAVQGSFHILCDLQMHKGAPQAKTRTIISSVLLTTRQGERAAYMLVTYTTTPALFPASGAFCL